MVRQQHSIYFVTISINAKRIGLVKIRKKPRLIFGEKLRTFVRRGAGRQKVTVTYSHRVERSATSTSESRNTDGRMRVKLRVLSWKKKREGWAREPSPQELVFIVTHIVFGSPVSQTMKRKEMLLAQSQAMDRVSASTTDTRPGADSDLSRTSPDGIPE